MIEFEVDKSEQNSSSMVSIKVIGVGGAGANTVNSIIESGCQGVEFIVVNTDAQALERAKAQNRVQIGIKSTKGLGTGSNPDLGKRSAEEDLDKVLSIVDDADIVFLAAGMGGGTGSGALPVIAHALREKGILSVAIVTKPFFFEGKRRARVAQEAIKILSQEVDTLLVIPNQKLLEVVDQNVSMIDAFSMINDVLSQSVRGISDIITKPGHINVDFADVRTIMKDKGLAVMGTGKASGENRAKNAAMQAISSPLLENMSVEGAHSVLFNITGGKDLGLHEISEAASVIYEQADEDANIILGSVIDESLNDEVVVTIIATGFNQGQKQDNKQVRSHVDIASSMHVRGTVLDRSGEALAASKPTQPATSPETEQKTEETQDLASQIQEEETAKEAEHAVSGQDSIQTSDDYAIVDLNDLDVPAFLRKNSEK